MRDIYLARIDKVRPALVLTREAVRDSILRVTVAPVTSTIKGLSTEVRLGPRNGLDGDCVASCDNVLTIDQDRLVRHVGFFFEDQEVALAAAITAAFQLRLGWTSESKASHRQSTQRQNG